MAEYSNVTSVEGGGYNYDLIISIMHKRLLKLLRLPLKHKT